MAYYICTKQYDSHYKLQIYDNLEFCITDLNKKLSAISSTITSHLEYSDLFDNFIHKSSILISWESDDISYCIGYLINDDVYSSDQSINENELELIKNDLYNYLHYLILPDDQLNQDNIDKIRQLDITLLTDYTINYKITNMIQLYRFFNISKEHVYQSFVYYLNKTIHKNKNDKPPNMVYIIDRFSSNEYNRDDLFKVLLYYLHKRKLNINEIDYKPYNTNHS
jgi:hypothetical protein